MKVLKPVLYDFDLTCEGVYAGSGYVPETPSVPSIPLIPTIATGCWDIHCEYRNHNTGHHSEVAIIGNHHGNHTGNSVVMTMQVFGFKLKDVIDKGGYLVNNICETGFTITRTGFFNGNDHFEFNIQITASDSPYSGSVGKTGDFIPCTIYCIAFDCK